MIPGITAGGMMMGGATPPGGGPVLLSVALAAYTSSTPSIALPATVDSGDLLVVVCANAGNAAGSVVTPPSGWSSITTARDPTNGLRVTVFALIAAGTEGGASPVFTSTNGSYFAVSVWRFKAGTFNGLPQGNATMHANASSHTPAALSPSWGAAATTFWAAILGWSGAPTISAYPYPSNQGAIATVSSPAKRQAICSTLDSGATLTPGPFLLDSAITAVTAVFAVRPA